MGQHHEQVARVPIDDTKRAAASRELADGRDASLIPGAAPPAPAAAPAPGARRRVRAGRGRGGRARRRCSRAGPRRARAFDARAAGSADWAAQAPARGAAAEEGGAPGPTPAAPRAARASPRSSRRLAARHALRRDRPGGAGCGRGAPTARQLGLGGRPRWGRAARARRPGGRRARRAPLWVLPGAPPAPRASATHTPCGSTTALLKAGNNAGGRAAQPAGRRAARGGRRRPPSRACGRCRAPPLAPTSPPPGRPRRRAAGALYARLVRRPARPHHDGCYNTSASSVKLTATAERAAPRNLLPAAARAAAPPRGRPALRRRQ